jgi:hypothetical protein
VITPHAATAQRTLLVVSVLAASAAAAACALPFRESSTDAHRSGSGMTVLAGEALRDGSGSVLDAIRGKTPSLRVREDMRDRCPVITLRNDASFQSQVRPAIYVDGTRATDTCILRSIRTVDVELVEIYPRGVTHRPGYGMHAHGLILLFMRS